MILVEMNEPFHVTAGAVGAPGARTFYLQAEDDAHRVTVIAEKVQVDALADALAALLAELDDAPSTDWDRTAMDLREPLDAVWRIGQIAVGLDEDRARFVLEIVELVPEDEEPDIARVWLNLNQARRLAAHAAEQVASGRPTCRFCGRPEGPDGHTCPATNGHGRLNR